MNALGRPLSSPDTSEEDRFDRISESVRDDADAMAEIDAMVAEHFGSEVATALADASQYGLVKALAEMPPVAALPAYQLDAFAALARLADQMAQQRELETQAEINRRFDESRPIRRQRRWPSGVPS